MKYFTLALLLASFAGALSAQNTPPGVTVFSNGTPVPNSGGVNVGANSTFNGMGLSYDVTDAEADDVGVTATVSNIGAAVNWTEATFNKAAQMAPWAHNVTSPLGEFGPANTVHVVTLTFDDGTDTTIFSFTISVAATPPSGGGVPGDGGGACTTGKGTHLPWYLAGAALAAIEFRRRLLRRE